jgi:hypothetical protein
MAKLDDDSKLTGGIGYFDFGNLVSETTLVKSRYPKATQRRVICMFMIMTCLKPSRSTAQAAICR